MKDKILIGVMSLLMPLVAIVLGAGLGESIEGESAIVTFDAPANCDSARMIFGYPDTSNLYDTVKITPQSVDSSILKGSVDLDSVGTHYVQIEYYETGSGSISGYSCGAHVHWPELASVDDFWKADSSDYGNADSSNWMAQQVIQGGGGINDSELRDAIGDTVLAYAIDSASHDNIIDLAFADYGVSTFDHTSDNITGTVGGISGITFPTNFADLSITSSTGLVDINDKTAFSLLASQWSDHRSTLESNLSSTHGSGSWEGTGLDSASTDNIIDLAMVNHRTELDSEHGDGSWQTGAGSDSTSIANAAADGVWKADSATYSGTSGTMGSLGVLQGEGGSGGSDTTAIKTMMINNGMIYTGEGEYACTLFVIDSSTSTAIPDVWVDVLTKDAGTRIARFNTNSDGRIIFNLNAADSLHYSAFKHGYTIATPQYITITEAQTDTILGDELSATAPSADMCTIQFLINPADYDTLSGVIFEWQLVDSIGDEIAISTHVTYGSGINTIRIPTTVKACTSSTSLFQKGLFKNAELNPSWTKYRMKVRWPDGDIAEIDTITVEGTSLNPFD